MQISVKRVCIKAPGSTLNDMESGKQRRKAGTMAGTVCELRVSSHFKRQKRKRRMERARKLTGKLTVSLDLPFLPVQHFVTSVQLRSLSFP